MLKTIKAKVIFSKIPKEKEKLSEDLKEGKQINTTKEEFK
jgi:hypothetical protein